MFDPETLHFNILDLLSAPRRAFKGKKIWAQLMGLAAGYAVYVLLTYTALRLDGTPLAAAWERFGIYPFFNLQGSWLGSTLAWGVYIMGAVLWLLIAMLSATAVARITYKELKGELFYSYRDGLAFTRKHWRAVVFSPVALVLLILFIMLMAGVMALIGRLPVLGEVIFVGLYPLYFAGAIFVLYSVVVLAVMLLYLPAIVALWEEDSMGSTFQAYSITWNQTWRTVVYSTLIGLLAIVSAALYGWALTAGYHFINWLFGAPWLMGDKLAPLIAKAESIVFSGYSSFFAYIPGQLAPASPLASGVELATLSGWQSLIGSLLAVVLVFIYGSVFAYGLSVISVGQTLSFLSFKYRIDDDNLLERPDEEDLAAEAEDGEPASKLEDGKNFTAAADDPPASDD